MTASWHRFIDDIQGLSDQVLTTSGNPPWYRGHGSATWILQSAIHRFIEELNRELGEQVTSAEQRNDLREECKSQYRQFQAYAWPLLNERERDTWGIVFTMQHYGIPTRLLDWTESFACALYFALKDRRHDEDAAIYVLDPVSLNRKTVDKDGLIALEVEFGRPVVNTSKWHPGNVPPLKDLKTIAVQPKYINHRMLAQRSAFTLCGDSFEPLDKQYPQCTRKMILPAKLFDDARVYLDLAGVGPYSYFPDLHGVTLKFEQRKRDWIDNLRHLRQKTKD